MDYDFVGGVVIRNLVIGYFVKAAFDYARHYEPPDSADWRTRLQGYLFLSGLCAAFAGLGVLMVGFRNVYRSAEPELEAVADWTALVQWFVVFFLTLLVPAVIGFEKLLSSVARPNERARELYQLGLRLPVPVRAALARAMSDSAARGEHAPTDDV